MTAIRNELGTQTSTRQSTARRPSLYRTTHGTEPTLDSILWRYGTQAVLGLRDASRAFPANSALGVLKWRFLTTEDSHAPLLLTCWRASPSPPPTVPGNTLPYPTVPGTHLPMCWPARP